MGFRELLTHLKEMKHYFIAALATFIVGAYLGYTQPDHFQFLLDAQMNRLRGIDESLSQMSHSGWWLFLFIFFNNSIVSVLMIYAGAIFAVIPLYFLLSNGLLLGYTALHQAPELGWIGLAKGILPHGIIEIPAILLACAYGLRFGFLMMEFLLSFPLPGRRAINSGKMVRFLKLTFPLMAVVTTMMLVAAVIESTVTLALLK